MSDTRRPPLTPAAARPATKCQRGHERCPAPVICNEAPVTPTELASLAASATNAAGIHQARNDIRSALGLPPLQAACPFPRHTRRNVLWTSYFLEEQLRLEIVAEHEHGEPVTTPA